jgi:integrase
MKSKGYNVEHVYLTDDEIARLNAIEFTPELKAEYKIDSKSNIEQSRDLFIIACKTGLRLSDLSTLNHSTWDLTTQTLFINTHKTQRQVVIPLSPLVIDIYNKYNGKLPKPADKSHYNKHIKLCSQIAGIDRDVYQMNRTGGVFRQVHYKKWERITSHTARRSFATNMYLKCGDAHLVMSITGHTTEENFLKYICVTKEQNAERARQYV